MQPTRRDLTPCPQDTLHQSGQVCDDVGPSIGFPSSHRILPSMFLDRVQSSWLDVWRASSSSSFFTVTKADAKNTRTCFEVAKVCLWRDQSSEDFLSEDDDMLIISDALTSENHSIEFEELSASISKITSIKARFALKQNNKTPVGPRSTSAMRPTSTQDVFITPKIDILISQLKKNIDSSNFEIRSIEDLVICRLLSVWQRDEQQTACRDVQGDRSFRRAKAFIDEHIAEKLVVSDIAKAAGVSVRRLQMIFQNRTGKTPKAYILEQRLDRVRADLCASAAERSSINTTAARWGFTHMGDFSRRYRARFGEVPSLTRRR